MLSETPRTTRSDRDQLASPVINITVTGSIAETRWSGSDPSAPTEGVSRGEPRVQIQKSSRGEGKGVGFGKRTVEASREDQAGSSGAGQMTPRAEEAVTGGGVTTPQPLGPRGLGLSVTRVEDPDPLDPNGLGLKGTRHRIRAEETVTGGGVTTPQPLGPSGLVSAVTRVEDPRPVDPGLGPAVTRVQYQGAGSASAAEVQAQNPSEVLGLHGSPGVLRQRVNRSGTGGRPETASDALGVLRETPNLPGLSNLRERVPLDRFRRPQGVKQKVILSCRGEDLAPFVYLTQHGGCLHSGTDCPPMRCSGQPIQRSLCRYCFDVQGSGLPSRRDASGNDRVVRFTKSGRYVHATETCRCLDQDEEMLHRKLCRCCRWGP